MNTNQKVKLLKAHLAKNGLSMSKQWLEAHLDEYLIYPDGTVLPVPLEVEVEEQKETPPASESVQEGDVAVELEKPKPKKTSLTLTNHSFDNYIENRRKRQKRRCEVAAGYLWEKIKEGLQ